LIITLIHNCHSYNPLIKNAVAVNLSAIESLGIDYTYILWNDNGDKKIEELLPKENNHNFFYYYSKKNYGLGNCTGGWIGAYLEGMVTGKYCHTFGHDDFFTPLFWKQSIAMLEQNDKLGAAFSNCYEVEEDFSLIKIPLPFNYQEFYTRPSIVFNAVFSPDNLGNFHSSNNFAYHPGVVHRSDLYDKIGVPDAKSFDGSLDFEYWVRMIFNGYGFFYIPIPTWFYTKSQYSLSKIIGGDDRRNIYNPRIVKKYEELYKRNGLKINTEPMLTEDKFW